MLASSTCCRVQHLLKKNTPSVTGDSRQQRFGTNCKIDVANIETRDLGLQIYVRPVMQQSACRQCEMVAECHQNKKQQTPTPFLSATPAHSLFRKLHLLLFCVPNFLSRTSLLFLSTRTFPCRFSACCTRRIHTRGWSVIARTTAPKASAIYCAYQ